MKIKVIKGKSNALEGLFEDWVDKNPNVVVHQISTTGTDTDYHGIYLTVLYNYFYNN